jgi:hypothetical protein
LRPSSADISEFGRKLNSLAFFIALCMTQMTVKLFVKQKLISVFDYIHIPFLPLS